ncbi:MAG TPA: SUMF1/EgtB/PvdO family nonheme iron enzyme [Lacipirellulaceae bacterium]|nr:SUMF1/EgtB/PvdO family nonheme iron enzyme [Lacipirellulaceae bacterium]
MKSASACALAVAFLLPVVACAITIDTVPVDNANNPTDFQSNGLFGRVTSDYRIGTTEVTNAQYVEFLNAVAASDPYSLYNTNMDFYSRGGITRSGSDGSYTYSVKSDVSGVGPGGTNYTYGDKPVIFVTWFDALRFANWVNNGATVGASTETGAYTLLGGTATPTNADSITRNNGATWFLPTENQWYKAAYYDGTAGSYYDYPTKSDAAPDNNIPLDDSGNSANYYNGAFTQEESYPLTAAGGYAFSASPYGTFDQGGNVWEWTETTGSPTSTRIIRGGAFDSDSSTLDAASRTNKGAALDAVDLGFRLATIAIPTGVPGDYNGDSAVDAADYILWRKNLGKSVALPNDSTPGTVSQADYDVWRTHFGQTSSSGSGSSSLLAGAVPEPSTCALFMLFACIAACNRARRSRLVVVIPPYSRELIPARRMRECRKYMGL